MLWDAWTTVAVLLLVFGLLAFTRIAPDLIFLGAVTLLITFQVLTPQEALAGRTALTLRDQFPAPASSHHGVLK